MTASPADDGSRESRGRLRISVPDATRLGVTTGDRVKFTTRRTAAEDRDERPARRGTCRPGSKPCALTG
ncbi:hypothetical protein V1227_04365 [Lentzea sp. DG1S-22]|uniref:hypothetical protein n=1 Tax=Lentzea sp. DG1S-22 TaxID=3108822 RepID=UPI002E78EC29|nr:hypothetical protein [Lentzea sp. DG1S-22]WVH81993.1 hypothetical protein V1227_04365 [Lentzea sp. DG1S-22]